MANLAAILTPTLVVGVPLALYVVFLGLSSIPVFQRKYGTANSLFHKPVTDLVSHSPSFLYAHKVHTLWWGDINEPEQWGFSSQSSHLPTCKDSKDDR